MAAYLRLRQICLVAPELESAVQAVRSIFGVEVCHRDEGVGKYGLVNALFTFGHAFLEIVAPTREGTTAGRFIERSGGRGGYMAIFDCSDPERRRAHALAMGIRLAHQMDYPGLFWGTQLHPVDCRATMIEFDRSVGADDLNGAYWPAGAHWHDTQRLDLVQGMPVIEVESSQVQDLARHWSALIEVPLKPDDSGNSSGGCSMTFDLGGVRFVPAPPGTPERVSAIHVQVPDVAVVLARAKVQGAAMEGNGFMLCGVRMVPCTIASI
jgi:hypothetical protein